ncbi:hypothetical protein DSECCO2_265890 [anaerobic digester metagenome]
MKGPKERPCWGCTERTPTCHGDCPEYLEAVERETERKKAAHRESRGKQDYIETKKTAIRRTIRGVHHRKEI